VSFALPARLTPVTAGVFFRILCSQVGVSVFSNVSRHEISGSFPFVANIRRIADSKLPCSCDMHHISPLRVMSTDVLVLCECNAGFYAGDKGMEIMVSVEEALHPQYFCHYYWPL